MTQNLINHIRNAAKTRDENIQDARDAFARRCQNVQKEMKALAPRINTLLEVANELDSNGFHCGQIESRGVIGSQCAEFLTDGLEHGLGFFTKENPLNGRFPYQPYAIGYEGGGYNGYRFVVHKDGEVDFHFSDSPRYDNREMQLKKAHCFLRQFDDFEKRFFDYVKSI